MQISIQFVLNDEKINLDYRRLFLSYIKSLIQSENPELFERYYGDGQNTLKTFTFWVNMPGAVFYSDHIEIQNKIITLYISSTDTKILTYIFSAAIKRKKEKYPILNANYMNVLSVKTSNTKTNQKNEVVIKMLSPIVSRHHVKDEKDRYFLFNENDFDKTVRINMKNHLGCEENEVPQIEAVLGKKVIVKAFNTSIPSSLGIYKLSGRADLIQQLYLNGIGSRTAEGFGKFEIIS